LAPDRVLLLGKLLERLAALSGGSLLDARIDALALQRDLMVARWSRAFSRALLRVRTSPLAPVAVGSLGELHLRPLALEVGEAEGHTRSPLSRTTR
jgi:hypothetical protein